MSIFHSITPSNLRNIYVLLYQLELNHTNFILRKIYFNVFIVHLEFTFKIYTITIWVNFKSKI
jgi:hypothetical protein